MSHLGSAFGSRSLGSPASNSTHTAWNTSPASSRDRPNLIGIEKMRFLYLSISADHASWLPLQHSRTNRSSVQADWRTELAGLTAYHRRKPRFQGGSRSVRRSTTCLDRGSQVENSPGSSWRPPEHRAWPEKRRAHWLQLSPAPGHRDVSVLYI